MSGELPRESRNELDLTSEAFLRTRAGEEIPKSVPFVVSGQQYPTAKDLAFVLQSDEPDSGVSLRHAGVIVRTSKQRREVLYNRDLYLSNRIRNAHLLVSGPTGGGKSTSIIDPLIHADIFAGKFLVIFDLKGTAYSRVKIWADEAGVPVSVLNFGDRSRSVGFNFLITNDVMDGHERISRLCELSQNQLSHDSAFWKQQMELAVTGAWEVGINNLPAIRHLYTTPRDELTTWLLKQNNRNCRQFGQFLQSGSQNADTSLATLIGAMNIFGTPDVAAVTSHHELDLAKTCERPGVLVVECQEHQLAALRPILNLFATVVLNQLIRANKALAKSIFFDDCPSLGPLRDLLDKLLTCRSRNVAVTCGAQGYSSVVHAYGSDAPALLDAFTTKAVFPGGSQEDAELFSRMSGDCEVIVKPIGGEPVIKSRYLFSPHDIRSPDCQHFLYGKPVTFFVSGTTFQAYLYPGYLQPELCKGYRASDSTQSLVRPRSLPLSSSPSSLPPSAASMKPEPDRQWSPGRLLQEIESARIEVGWNDTTGSARRWWMAFEAANQSNSVHWLLQELRNRKATITEFFIAVVYSNTDSIHATLLYLDYSRLRKSEANKKRSAKQKADDETDRPRNEGA